MLLVVEVPSDAVARISVLFPRGLLPLDDLLSFLGFDFAAINCDRLRFLNTLILIHVQG